MKKEKKDEKKRKKKEYLICKEWVTVIETGSESGKYTNKPLTLENSVFIVENKKEIRKKKKQNKTKQNKNKNKNKIPKMYINNNNNATHTNK